MASAEDRTIVSKLIALNAVADGIGAPMQRDISVTDATMKETYELDRELLGHNESHSKLVTPEAILRSWVIDGSRTAKESMFEERSLAQNNESLGLLQDVQESTTSYQLALQEAADVLRGRSLQRSNGLENMTTRSTSPRRSEKGTRKIEYRLGGDQQKLLNNI